MVLSAMVSLLAQTVKEKQLTILNIAILAFVFFIFLLSVIIHSKTKSSSIVTSTWAKVICVIFFVLAVAFLIIILTTK